MLNGICGDVTTLYSSFSSFHNFETLPKPLTSDSEKHDRKRFLEKWLFSAYSGCIHEANDPRFKFSDFQVITKMNTSSDRVLMQGYVLATGPNIGFAVGYKRFYFVLTDNLAIYETQESFDSGCKPVGILSLDVFNMSVTQARGKHEFVVFAYNVNRAIYE